LEILELQQANIERWPDRRLLMLNIDSGGVKSRRLISKYMAHEKS